MVSDAKIQKIVTVLNQSKCMNVTKDLRREPEISLQHQLEHQTHHDSNSTIENVYLKEHLGIHCMSNSQSDTQINVLENNFNSCEDLSFRVAQKLRMPAVPRPIFSIQKVSHSNPISSAISPNRKNEESHCPINELPCNNIDQGRKLLGSKRRLFETSNVA